MDFALYKKLWAPIVVCVHVHMCMCVYMYVCIMCGCMLVYLYVCSVVVSIDSSYDTSRMRQPQSAVWSAYGSVGISFSTFVGQLYHYLAVLPVQSARVVRHCQVHSMHIKWNISFRLPLKGYNVSKLINASFISASSSKRWEMSEGA